MAARVRVGVALVVEGALADEVDGLRRALGDMNLGRIPPHLTLVAPVNLRTEQLPVALSRLRAAGAAISGPLRVVLGPPATFLPANPVIFLSVSGDLEGLGSVRQAAFAPPLERPPSWPWVPHVTLADDAAPARIAAALDALGDYRVEAAFERVTLLQKLPAGWEPLADVAFGPPSVVGRGGLPLEITRSTLVDPEGLALVGAQPNGARLVLTARREDEMVGLALLTPGAGPSGLSVTVAEAHLGTGVGEHLAAAARSAAASAGWDPPDAATTWEEGRAADVRRAPATG